MRRALAFCMWLSLALSTSEILAISDLEPWIAGQRSIARANLLKNISPAGTKPGCVIASPSRQDPDYFFHWVRDAALVLDVVQRLNSDPLDDFIRFTQQNQMHPALGEPKFNVDGSPFAGPWGRPQNDGPALRAITLMKYANRLLAEGKEDYVRQTLYDGKFPTKSVIKLDLEHVSHQWHQPGFDLWEETSGDHFYTRLVQHRAMVEGAAFAERLGDGGAARHYRNEAVALENALNRHWDVAHGRLRPTLNRVGGIDYKTSDLDTAVVLASLHGTSSRGAFSPSDPRILATAEQIRKRFKTLYPINNHFEGTAIGRYPEDRYNGISDKIGAQEGNPWFLTTLAFAELYSRAATEFKAAGAIEITEVNRPFLETLTGSSLNLGRVSYPSILFAEIILELHRRSDSFFWRVSRHADSSGAMSEQINRHTGHMQGATHLTWSYAAFLSASDAR